MSSSPPGCLTRLWENPEHTCDHLASRTRRAFVILLAGFGAGIYFLHLSFIPVAPPALPPILLMSFFLAFNTMFLGIIGENVGRIYNQGKSRLLYLVDEQGNFDECGENRHIGHACSADRQFADSTEVS